MITFFPLVDASGLLTLPVVFSYTLQEASALWTQELVCSAGEGNKACLSLPFSTESTCKAEIRTEGRSKTNKLPFASCKVNKGCPAAFSS